MKKNKKQILMLRRMKIYKIILILMNKNSFRIKIFNKIIYIII